MFGIIGALVLAGIFYWFFKDLPAILSGKKQDKKSKNNK